MTVRKVYEIALRVLGVLFLAQAIRSLIQIITVVGGYVADFWIWDNAFAYVAWSMGALLASGTIATLLLKRGKRWAASLAPIDEVTGVQLNLPPEQVLAIGLTLLGVWFLVAGLSQAIGTLAQAIHAYSPYYHERISFNRALRTDQLVANIIQAIVGAFLITYRSMGRRTQKLGVFLDSTRSDDASNGESLPT